HRKRTRWRGLDFAVKYSGSRVCRLSEQRDDVHVRVLPPDEPRSRNDVDRICPLLSAGTSENTLDVKVTPVIARPFLSSTSTRCATAAAIVCPSAKRAPRLRASEEKVKSPRDDRGAARGCGV